MLNLLPALIKAKQAFTAIPKDKKGNYGKYSSLDAVLAATEPALLENGLILSHQISEGFLRTILYHSSGESIESVIKLPEIADPQKIGSAISYYRRYSICCLLSVCADEDDDGTTAAASAKAAPAATRSQPASYAKPADPSAENKQKVLALINGKKWPAEKAKAWAASFDPRPKEVWEPNVWRMAVESLEAIDD